MTREPQSCPICGPEVSWKLGGAVLCFGEQGVREVRLDLVEVVLERRERVVLRLSEKQVELGSVQLEAIDLAVLKF